MHLIQGVFKTRHPAPTARTAILLLVISLVLQINVRPYQTRWLNLLEEGSTARQETTLPTDNSTIPKLMYSRRGIANMANVAQLTDSPWST